MTSLLSGSLATTIYGTMKNLFLDATFVHDVLPNSPAFDPADPSAPVPVSYPCKAIRDSYSAFDMANNAIATGDSKILILVNSLAITPRSNDRVTIQDATFEIVKVDVDPAMAVWICQGRQ